MGLGPASLHDVLKRLAPGTPLRRALQRIIQERKGALIILGWGPEVEEICSGGFLLDDSHFSPAKLAELAKMDGAIITDDAAEFILRANVHLLPKPEMPTTETGARHRTAERAAAQTGKPVVAVSEDRLLATVFFHGDRRELESPTVLNAKVNQSLHTLERFRRRLTDAEEQLTRLEVTDLVTNRAVITVLQRAELVRRIGDDIRADTIGLGEEGDLVQLQMADLMQGVDELRDLVLADYVRPYRANRVRAALDGLQQVATADLPSAQKVAAAMGFDHPETQVRPRGLRLLDQVPRLPEPVRSAVVRRFRDFQQMLHAGADELAKVDGVGRARAAQVRHFFDRLIDATQMWNASFDD